jgi:hypothetical protein
MGGGGGGFYSWQNSKNTVHGGGFECKNCKYFLGTTQKICFSVVVLGYKMPKICFSNAKICFRNCSWVVVVVVFIHGKIPKILFMVVVLSAKTANIS